MMSEIEEMEFDQRMLSAAMNNTYLILVGKASYENLLEQESMQIIDGIRVVVLINKLRQHYYLTR